MKEKKEKKKKREKKSTLVEHIGLNFLYLIQSCKSLFKQGWHPINVVLNFNYQLIFRIIINLELIFLSSYFCCTFLQLSDFHSLNVSKHPWFEIKNKPLVRFEFISLHIFGEPAFLIKLQVVKLPKRCKFKSHQQFIYLIFFLICTVY